MIHYNHSILHGTARGKWPVFVVFFYKEEKKILTYVDTTVFTIFFFPL